jgi:excisionase family DNA binding protein
MSGKNGIDEKQYFTVKETAEYLGIHESTVYKLARAGVLPAFHIQTDWRFRRCSLDEWAATQEQALKALKKKKDD